MPTDRGELSALVEERRSSDEHLTWGYHSRVSVTHRYVCVAIPKVACTTVKTVLRTWEGLPASDDVHEEGPRLEDFTTGEIATMLTSPDWLRFAFVRNPYARLFSAYKSKIGNTRDREYDWLRDQIREAFGYPSRNGARVGTVTFDDYVRFLAGSDDPQVVRDGHLDVQVRILQRDCIPYDILGRFENFRHDFDAILSRLDAPPRIRALAGDVLNSTPYLPLATAYRRELADIVHAVYEADFEELGYARDSWLHE
ncbi:sulfotransferase family 2 domain-containing protein [Actinopolymorpha sp. NPDC004070]|uniref:sulfotransferase family 2 domain-containing protein n=1 Tax=Actinopolymorpha sp. NPDC004070 TaxID=3154548 RepID=UPI0033A71AD0